MKYLYIVLVLLVSCNRSQDVKILNQNLISEIESFIKKIDRNSPCKSNYISVRIEESEIIMGNYKPQLTKDFHGKSKLGMSEIYFFCSGDCSDYISTPSRVIIDTGNDTLAHESCEPPMYKILVIDKNDRSKFHHLPPSNLENAE